MLTCILSIVAKIAFADGVEPDWAVQNGPSDQALQYAIETVQLKQFAELWAMWILIRCSVMLQLIGIYVVCRCHVTSVAG